MKSRILMICLSVFSMSAQGAATPKQQVFVREVVNKDGTYSYLYRIANNETNVKIAGADFGSKDDDICVVAVDSLAYSNEVRLDKSSSHSFRVGSVIAPEGFEHEIQACEDGGDAESPLWSINVSFRGFRSDILSGESLGGIEIRTKKKEPLFMTLPVQLSVASRPVRKKNPVITPVPETLSASELLANPKITSLTVTPSTMNVEKLSGQKLNFTFAVQAESGDTSNPVIRVHDLSCTGFSKKHSFFPDRFETVKFSNDSFYLFATPDFAKAEDGRQECSIEVAASNRAGNRVFQKATFHINVSKKK